VSTICSPVETEVVQVLCSMCEVIINYRCTDSVCLAGVSDYENNGGLCIRGTTNLHYI